MNSIKSSRCCTGIIVLCLLIFSRSMHISAPPGTMAGGWAFSPGNRSRPGIGTEKAPADFPCFDASKSRSSVCRIKPGVAL